MVDPLAAASDMPSARRQTEAAAAPPALAPAAVAAGKGAAHVSAAAGDLGTKRHNPPRFPALDLAAEVDPAAIQGQQGAAGVEPDLTGTAGAGRALLAAAGAAQKGAGPMWRWEGVPLAAAAAAGGGSVQQGRASGGGEAAQRSPLLLEQGWLQRSDSPLWGPQEMLEVAAAAAAQMATSPPEAAARAAAAACNAYSPGPLQDGLQAKDQARAVQQQQRAPQERAVPASAAAGLAGSTRSTAPAPPPALKGLGHTASGVFVTARSDQSSEEQAGKEQARSHGDEEAASPSTEPLR